MGSQDYPLGHEEKEAKRLDHQASLFEVPALSKILPKSKRCLEIGCGTGSNIDKFLSINPDLIYVGIDVNRDAIDSLSRQKLHKNASIQLMDATQMSFPDNSFDLVISNLVMWAIGEQVLEACKEVFRVLKNGGVFYSFEPDDETLMFYPKKKFIIDLMALWDKKMIEKGLNPFVGREMHSRIHEAGFSSVDTEIFSKLSMGSKADSYDATMKNLQGIYMGTGPSFIDLTHENKLWTEAEREFEERGTQHMTLESYFVNIARK